MTSVAWERTARAWHAATFVVVTTGLVWQLVLIIHGTDGDAKGGAGSRVGRLASKDQVRGNHRVPLGKLEVFSGAGEAGNDAIDSALPLDLHQFVARGLIYPIDEELSFDPDALLRFYQRPDWPDVLRLFANVDEDEASVAAQAAAAMRELALAQGTGAMASASPGSCPRWP